MKPVLTPRKQPQQGRARATWEAVLDAAAQLLREEGAASLTTNRVAERAGVSIGSLYQYFPTKQAIYAELSRRQRADLKQDFDKVLNDPAVRALPLPQLVRCIMDASLLHHARDPVFARRVEQLEQELALQSEIEATKSGVTAQLVDFLREIGVPRPEIVTRDLSAMAMGMSHAALQAGETDFDDLADRLTRAALGYLTPSQPD